MAKTDIVVNVEGVEAVKKYIAELKFRIKVLRVSGRVAKRLAIKFYQEKRIAEIENERLKKELADRRLCRPCMYGDDGGFAMNGSDVYEFEREPQWMQCPQCLTGHMCETKYGFWCENCGKMAMEDVLEWEHKRKIGEFEE